MFAFPLGFHDVILPLLAFTCSSVCLWLREEGVIFYFNCSTMQPVLSRGWIFGCSVWCALSNVQNNLEERLPSCSLGLRHRANVPPQLILPFGGHSLPPKPYALSTWKRYFSKQNKCLFSSVSDYTNRASHWPPWPVSWQLSNKLLKLWFIPIGHSSMVRQGGFGKRKKVWSPAGVSKRWQLELK